MSVDTVSSGSTTTFPMTGSVDGGNLATQSKGNPSGEQLEAKVAELVQKLLFAKPGEAIEIGAGSKGTVLQDGSIEISKQDGSRKLIKQDGTTVDPASDVSQEAKAITPVEPTDANATANVKTLNLLKSNFDLIADPETKELSPESYKAAVDDPRSKFNQAPAKTRTELTKALNDLNENASLIEGLVTASGTAQSSRNLTRDGLVKALATPEVVNARSAATMDKDSISVLEKNYPLIEDPVTHELSDKSFQAAQENVDSAYNKASPETRTKVKEAWDHLMANRAMVDQVITASGTKESSGNATREGLAKLSGAAPPVAALPVKATDANSTANVKTLGVIESNFDLIADPDTKELSPESWKAAVDDPLSKFNQAPAKTRTALIQAMNDLNANQPLIEGLLNASGTAQSSKNVTREGLVKALATPEVVNAKSASSIDEDAVRVLEANYSLIEDPVTHELSDKSFKTAQEKEDSAYNKAPPETRAKVKEAWDHVMANPAMINRIIMASGTGGMSGNATKEGLSRVSGTAPAVVPTDPTSTANANTLRVLHTNFDLIANPETGTLNVDSWNAAFNDPSSNFNKAPPQTRADLTKAWTELTANEPLIGGLITASGTVESSQHVTKAGLAQALATPTILAAESPATADENAVRLLASNYELIEDPVTKELSNASFQQALTKGDSAFNQAPPEIRTKLVEAWGRVTANEDLVNLVIASSGTAGTTGNATKEGLTKALIPRSSMSHLDALKTLDTYFPLLANGDVVSLDALKTAVKPETSYLTKGLSKEQELKLKEAAQYVLDHPVEFANLDIASTINGKAHHFPADNLFSKEDLKLEIEAAASEVPIPASDARSMTHQEAVAAVKEHFPLLADGDLITDASLEKAANGKLNNDKDTTDEEKATAIAAAQYFRAHKREWTALEASHTEGKRGNRGTFDMATRLNDVRDSRNHNIDGKASADDVKYEELAVSNTNHRL